jgi:hypothetical protein
MESKVRCAECKGLYLCLPCIFCKKMFCGNCKHFTCDACGHIACKPCYETNAYLEIEDCMDCDKKYCPDCSHPAEVDRCGSCGNFRHSDKLQWCEECDPSILLCPDCRGKCGECKWTMCKSQLFTRDCGKTGCKKTFCDYCFKEHKKVN